MPIGLQEWIVMITMIVIPMTTKIKMKTAARKKTKLRTNLNKLRINSNKLTLKRSKTSSEMQEKKTNPNVHVPNDNANEEQLEHPVDQQKTSEESTRRSAQESRPIKRLEPKMSGKLYMQGQKKVNFKSATPIYNWNTITT
jgi:hypothetical protein